MGKRGGKKKRSVSKTENPQIQSPVAGRKVGMICCSMSSGKDGDYEIQLYMIDIDRESRPPCGPVEYYATATPAVRFIFPISDDFTAVCVLKSTVYFFAGCTLGGYGHSREIFAKKFVLTEEVLAQGNYRVEKAQLVGISDMHYAKGVPLAIPTPDGENIIVFGAQISEAECSRAFELYNPRLDSWEKLPGLPWNCYVHDGQPCTCLHSVSSYGFVGKSQSHFLVQTKIASFGLNLADKNWSTVSVPSIPWASYFLTAKDQYVLTPKRTYNLHDGKGFLLEGRNKSVIPPDSHLIHGPPIPLSTFAPPNPPDWQQDLVIPSIVHLHPFLDGHVCNSCVLQLEEYDFAARILIDVCATDLTTLETIVSKCVSLRINFLAGGVTGLMPETELKMEQGVAGKNVVTGIDVEEPKLN